MKWLLIALCLTIPLLGGCGKREVEKAKSPQLNAERILENRTKLLGCVQAGWAHCRGGFVVDTTEPQVLRIVVDDPSAEHRINDAVDYDDIRSSQLVASSLRGEVGDAYLSRVIIVLPRDRDFDRTGARYNRQRTQ